MRVLYVLPSLLTGGAEALVSQWAALLHRDAHEVEVCTLYAGGPFAVHLTGQGIRVHNLDHDPGIVHYNLRRKYDPRLALKLANVVGSGGYSIVHGHLFPSLLYLACVSYLHPRPAYLYSEHSVNNRRRRSAAWKALDRFLYSRFRRVLPVSEGVRVALVHWLPELDGKARVVPNTVAGAQPAPPTEAAAEAAALRRELGIAADEYVVLFAGRLIPEKGPDLLIEAAERLARECDLPVRFLLAGDGPLRPELEARARSLPLPARASFLGRRGDVPQLIALADLVILPSRWEGLPMFLLEAMSAGKAVLAAAVGGIPEAVRHGESGWLVSAEDPAALAAGLAAGLAHLLPQPALRAQLGAGARRSFEERYAPEKAVGSLLKVYEEAVLEIGK